MAFITKSIFEAIEGMTFTCELCQRPIQCISRWDPMADFLELRFECHGRVTVQRIDRYTIKRARQGRAQIPIMPFESDRIEADNNSPVIKVQSAGKDLAGGTTLNLRVHRLSRDINAGDRVTVAGYGSIRLPYGFDTNFIGVALEAARPQVGENFEYWRDKVERERRQSFSVKTVDPSITYVPEGVSFSPWERLNPEDWEFEFRDFDKSRREAEEKMKSIQARLAKAEAEKREEAALQRAIEELKRRGFNVTKDEPKPAEQPTIQIGGRRKIELE